jgi:hypothetical protein
MVKPYAVQEVQSLRIYNTAHVRHVCYIKSKTYSTELWIGSIKSSFHHNAGKVCPKRLLERLTSGDNIHLEMNLWKQVSTD